MGRYLSLLVFIFVVIGDVVLAQEMPEHYKRMQELAKEHPPNKDDQRIHLGMSHVMDTWISTAELLFNDLSQESHAILGKASLRTDWELINFLMERDKAISTLCADRDGVAIKELALNVFSALHIPYYRQVASFRNVLKSLSVEDRETLVNWEYFEETTTPDFVGQPMSRKAAEILFNEFEIYAEDFVTKMCGLHSADVRYEVVERRSYQSSQSGFGVISMMKTIRSYEVEKQ